MGRLVQTACYSRRDNSEQSAPWGLWIHLSARGKMGPNSDLDLLVVVRRWY